MTLTKPLITASIIYSTLFLVACGGGGGSSSGGGVSTNSGSQQSTEVINSPESDISPAIPAPTDSTLPPADTNPPAAETIPMPVPEAELTPTPTPATETEIEPQPEPETTPPQACLNSSNFSVEFETTQDWNDGGMVTVIVRNNSPSTLHDWTVSWRWPGNQVISHPWNAEVTQTGAEVEALCSGEFCEIDPGRAQAFGFNISYQGANNPPIDLLLVSSTCDGSANDNPDTPPQSPGTPVSDTFNYILGTQTIGPGYSLSSDTKLVETAKRIRDMGSNFIKIALDPYLYDDMSQYNSYQYQFLSLLEKVPAFKQVLDMDFAYYMLWVEDSGSWTDDQGLSELEAQYQYQKIYAITEYFLTAYNDTGKTFMIGNWEGDWQMVWNGTSWDDSVETVHPNRIQGMIDWLNIRQKAVEDAKAAVAHSNVEVLHYVEVNRVLSAMAGKERITNKVLPYTNVDLVSYSAYDITTQEANVDYATLRSEMHAALNFIESNLAPKSGLPFSKRVFIGEYGYASYWWEWDWGEERHTLQNTLSKNVMKATIEWGTPFVLYWQMYDNEFDSSVGKYKGYWMITDDGVKLPIYYSHKDFYAQAKSWVQQFSIDNSRKPSETEFRAQALHIIDGLQTRTDPSPQNPAPNPVPAPAPGGDGDIEQVAVWFVGDSITYGMTTLPYNTQGFRTQIWQSMVDSVGTFNFSVDSGADLTTISYSAIPMRAVGTVTGPAGPEDISQQSKNYWHSGFPGATTGDLMCFLDPSGYTMPSGYTLANCADSLATFNYIASANCREGINSGGWTDNPGCYLDQNINATDAVLIPIQLGTNDISILNANGAINCSQPPQPGDSSATRLQEVVDELISDTDFTDSETLVGKIYQYLTAKGINKQQIAFIISMIPARDIGDGQDPNNYCTNYFNAAIEDRVTRLGISDNVFLANQGNVVANADPVHPNNQGHAVMACNLLYGYDYAAVENFNCPIPNSLPNNGFLKALSTVIQ